MDPQNLQKQREPEEPRFLNFRHLPDGTMRDGKLALNKFSSTLTNAHDFPGAQVHHTKRLSCMDVAEMCAGNAVCGWRTGQALDEE